MTGQTPITRATRVAAGALGVPAQLLADADAATGALPGAADLVATAARLGVTPTALLEHVLEKACPPPPQGPGLTTRTKAPRLRRPVVLRRKS